MSSIRTALAAQCKNLPLDTSLYHLPCPFCHGGAHKDRAFVVTRKSRGIAYKCHRAKCGKAGFVRIGHQLPIYEEKKKVEPERLDLGKMRILTSDVGVFHKLCNSYGIGLDILENNQILAAEDMCMVAPLFNLAGQVIGHQYRWYDGKRPKAKTTWYDDANPHIHFPAKVRGMREYPTRGLVCIVEDAISAIKVNDFMRTAALLGTNLNQLAAASLSNRFERLVIWLDSNALNQAAEIARSYNGLFTKGVRVIHTEKDPKDLSYEEIQEVIEKYLGSWKVGDIKYGT